MKYYIVQLVDAANVIDLISKIAMEQFESLGQSNFSLEEAQVDEILGERAFSGGDIPLEVIEEVESSCRSLPVEFYFEREELASAFLKEIEQKYMGVTAKLTEKEVRDWNATWRMHYSTIKVDDVITIYPEWMKDEVGEREIKIYPGQGFGTGEHETTWLCIEHLGKLISKGGKIESCLDFGCGSGILGISATKLVGCITDYCDIDRAALDNCLGNIILNFPGKDFLGSRLVIRERFVAEKKYDLVFANILLNILIEEEETLASSLNSGGILIVSGILKDQQAELLNRFSKRFKVRYDSLRNDWSAVTLEKI